MSNLHIGLTFRGEATGVSATQIKHAIGCQQALKLEQLAGAVMSLCTLVAKQQKRIVSLERQCAELHANGKSRD